MKKINFLNLGQHPITNNFLSQKNPKNEFFYNLKLVYNTSTKLISLGKFVSPKKMFNNKYAHRASASKTMQAAYKKLASKLKEKFKPNSILEIGSNDGVFIKHFTNIKNVGVEPCKNLAEITKNKFRTYPNFWNKKLSKKILKEYPKIDLIFSANTISHIPNLKETFEAILNVISNKGVLVIEDPSLSSVIKTNSYDQFYDEHVYVFSALAIKNIVKKYNLRLFDAEKISTHGGSLRYFICKNNSTYKNTNRLNKILSDEKKIGLNNFKTFVQFAKRVKTSKRKLVSLLKKLKKNNKKIISYGATYKSTTVFNYCKIDTKYFHYVTDTTFNKQGKFTPGTHIPIISPEIGFNDSVDYAFLGAWNFKKEILNKEKNFIDRGGKFITHVPKVKILRK